MKCARCGYEVASDDPVCPHCGGRGRPDERTASGRDASGGECCPVCGSPHVYPVRRAYNPGCGCLGFLLFSWLGLLLGLLDSGRIDMVCRDCGARWPFRR